MMMAFMRLPWQPLEYARTCTECGYSWQVPRWAARRHVAVPVVNMWMPQVRTFDEKVTAIEARNQQADTYRICSRCGAETFTQQPVRSKPPG
jgi:ribosomal protein L37E